MKNFILFLLIGIPSVCHSKPVDYWSLEVPVPKEATDVRHDKSQHFYTITTQYEIRIVDTDEIYELYQRYFSAIGWKDPMADFPKNGSRSQGSWSSYRANFGSDGLPEAAYASMWKAEKMPAYGSVLVTLTSYENEVFTATVKVVLTPEVDTSALIEMQQLIVSDPKILFALHKIIGANPFEVEEVVETMKNVDKSSP
ncbi:hypothetical protein [Motiliproteus sp. MSK22-1]|uniref:hypothetical protein n=1 Tax=Motiliproteus sp. MSK22-1 TaxID=1897630 RepID=UPI000977BC77|nr:hypothetical protein [Motiliproteus sp. MSK22-1]OMH36189.1 hypothetical protein BGP75_10125 [Motiliproteus sp. MSK22-1]